MHSLGWELNMSLRVEARITILLHLKDYVIHHRKFCSACSVFTDLPVFLQAIQTIWCSLVLSLFHPGLLPLLSVLLLSQTPAVM